VEELDESDKNKIIAKPVFRSFSNFESILISV
jgi:hypothetical protein